MSEILALCLLGEFSPQQEEILSANLELDVFRIDSCEESLPGSIVAVRSGRPVLADTLIRNDIPMVISAGRGKNNIAETAGVLIDNCDGNIIEVAAHTISLLSIAIQNRVVALNNDPGALAANCYLEDLEGKNKFAIIGAGGIGSQIAILLSEYGILPNLVRNPMHEPESFINLTIDLESAVNQSEVIILAVGEKDLITPEIISKMHNGQIIINIGRGNVINPQAYKDLHALGVSLYTDVWPDEPRANGQIPDSLSQEISRGTWGTMHEAAQQTTANNRIASEIVERVKFFQESRIAAPHPLTLDKYRQKLRAFLPHKPDLLQMLSHVEQSPDRARVDMLARHLLSLAGQQLEGTANIWHPIYIDPVITPLNKGYSLVNKLIALNQS